MKKFFYRLSIFFGVIIIVAGLGLLARHEIQRVREGLPPFTHSAGSTSSEMVTMKDGTQLYTTISLPEAPKTNNRFPTVLIRNPYAQFGTVMRDSLCGRFVRYGYACVLQDVRGQGKSEGDWSPGINEAKDGRDTIEWLVAQNFQDGNVGMMGPSYLASVQWAAASMGLPKEVKTMIPAVYTTDLRGVMYQDGMFRHETFTAWASMMRTSSSNPEGSSEAFSETSLEGTLETRSKKQILTQPHGEHDDAGAAYQAALQHRPHIEVDTAIFGVDLPWYRQMVSASNPNDPFWQIPETIALREAPENIDIPILMIGGWYDVFFGPQLEDWNRLATQNSSRFIIGPWTHAGGGGSAFDNPDADGGLFQWHATLDWFGHHLKGDPLQAKLGVDTYTIGAGRWQHHDHWPQETTNAVYHLTDLAGSEHCSGGTLTDGGTLREGATSTTKSPVSYSYDPENPVPTRGGAGMLAFILPGFEGAPPANVWQEALCERSDILSFSTPILDASMLISGTIEVQLDVSSSAPDTAFTAKLVEVMTDGRAVNIRDSITSLLGKKPGHEDVQQDTAKRYTPNTRTSVDIRFWPIEWQVQPGSRLRLDISSSDFPKFHAHPNRADHWSRVKTPVTATQTLYGGLLTLPIHK